MYVGKGCLVFKAPDPIAVRAVLPHAKILDYKGKPHIAIKHDLDAVAILRNIGIEAPSPVNFDWTYPGRFKPFKHQQATVEFLTIHRRAFVLSGMGCVDADTEYLAPTGWSRIADYVGGEVGQFDPTTGQVSFVEPTRYINEPCDSMVHLKTAYGVDQMLSDEHRVLVYDREHPDRYEVLTARDLESRLHGAPLDYPSRWAWEKGRQIGRQSLGFKTTFIPPARSGVPLADAELRLQVAVQADGYFDPHSDKVTVRLKKQRKKDRLVHLLQTAGVDYTESSKDYPTARGVTVYRFYAPLRTKTYKFWGWECSASQLAVIVDEFAHWGRSMRKASGKTFFTADESSADFIQYACAASGFTAHKAAQMRKRRGCVEIEWRVNVRPRGDVLGVITGTPEGRKPGVSRRPPVDGRKYCFTVPTGFLVLRRNGCIFVTGNSGKSAASLWACEYLMQQGLIRRALIVCPKSCTHKVWEDEIFQLLMHRSSVVIEGGRDRKRDLAASDSDFIIVNHDGLMTIADIVKADARIDLVIYDEASAIRNSQTQRYKTLKGLLKPATRLWLLTATPCPNAPTDAWALARLVRPENVPPYFTSFKRQTMIQVTQFKWIPKPEATQMVYECLQPAIRFRTEDCIDLPPVTYQNRSCDLSPEQARMMKDMSRQMVADKDGSSITAANAAVKMFKLLQIACGAVYDDDGTTQRIDADDRVNTLKEILEEADHKVIVWVPFKHTMQTLKEELSKDWSVALINGDTSAGERAKIITAFQDPDRDPKVLIAHPATAAHGLTLTAANICVWYGPTFSAEHYEQANARVARPGQKHHMSIIHIGSTPLEWEAYQIANTKVDRQKKILDLYRKVVDIPV